MLMVCFWVLAAATPTHGGSSASVLRFFPLLGWLANRSCSGSVSYSSSSYFGVKFLQRVEVKKVEEREWKGANGWLQRRKEGRKQMGGCGGEKGRRREAEVGGEGKQRLGEIGVR
ncbi:hypothetical protein ACFX13_037043 [Malus domestica]